MGCRTVISGDNGLPLAADGGDLILASLSGMNATGLAAYWACLAAAVLSADLISGFLGVLLKDLPLCAFPNLGGSELVTLGTFGPGVAGGVSSLLIITGLGGGGMATLVGTLGDLPLVAHSFPDGSSCIQCRGRVALPPDVV